MADAVVDLFRRLGCPARLLDIPGGYPAVWAEIPGAAGRADGAAVRALRRAAGAADQGWDTDPFVASTGADGRIYGRGAADDKSGLVIHAGTLRALGPTTSGGDQDPHRG